MAEFSGIPEGNFKRFAVVGSRFNESVTRALVDGALDCLVRHGAAVEDVDVIWVPGAWELPAAAARLASSDRYAAIVACGAVVRGDTPHFDFISTEATRGLGAVQHDYNVPVGFGLLTTTRSRRPRNVRAVRTATRDGMRRLPRSRCQTCSRVLTS